MSTAWIEMKIVLINQINQVRTLLKKKSFIKVKMKYYQYVIIHIIIELAQCMYNTVTMRMKLIRRLEKTKWGVGKLNKITDNWSIRANICVCGVHICIQGVQWGQRPPPTNYFQPTVFCRAYMHSLINWIHWPYAFLSQPFTFASTTLDHLIRDASQTLPGPSPLNFWLIYLLSSCS